MTPSEALADRRPRVYRPPLADSQNQTPVIDLQADILPPAIEDILIVINQDLFGPWKMPQDLSGSRPVQSPFFDVNMAKLLTHPASPSLQAP